MLILIEGVEKDSTLMIPDTDILFEKPTGVVVVVPTFTNILAVMNIEEIEALMNGTTTYKPRNFIPIAPFLCKAICELIERSRGDSKELLLEFVLAIKAFDSKHDTDAKYKQKSRQKCKDMLYWIYSASQDNSPIKSIPTTVNKSSCIRENSELPSFNIAYVGSVLGEWKTIC